MESNGNAPCCFGGRCGAEVALREQVTLCPKCGGLLEVVYDMRGLRRSAHLFREFRQDSIWRWRDFFPAVKDEHIVSLGEGGTPLIKSKYLGPALGIENLYFKNDTLIPTGSFKDRGYSLAVSYAMEIGVKRGITYSSGNAGASFAAYSARAGFPGLVMVEYLASPTKKAMIMLYGAKSAVLHFKDFAQVAKLLEYAVGELGCYAFVNFINPIRHEAMKTYAYEIYSQLRRPPDWSFHGTGTGGGVYGAWKGYRELAEIGVTDRIPRMAAVQPESVAWIKAAIDSGAEEGALFGEVGHTIAQSICGNSPLQGGKRLLRCIRESGGLAMAVTDDEILEAMQDLGHEGIAAEPSSAATVAACKQAVKAGRIHAHETVVCTITGTAFKQPSVVERLVSAPQHTLEATNEDLRKLLAELDML